MLRRIMRLRSAFSSLFASFCRNAIVSDDDGDNVLLLLVLFLRLRVDRRKGPDDSCLILARFFGFEIHLSLALVVLSGLLLAARRMLRCVSARVVVVIRPSSLSRLLLRFTFRMRWYSYWLISTPSGPMT